MINMQLLDGALIALAVLVGLAIALSLTMLAAGSVAKPGQAPHGGIKRDLPQQPQPDTDDAREDDARELVLL
jgi:hypothetical protein